MDSSKKNQLSKLEMEEKARLKKDIYRSDMEKLELFVEMLQRNALFKKARITHK